MLQIDQINKIRKDFTLKKFSIHKISKIHHRSWETVHRYVYASIGDLVMPSVRIRLKIVVTEKVVAAIHSYFDDEIEKKVHRKQRYTAKYIFKKLVEQNIYQGSSRQLRDVVKKLREERSLLKKKPGAYLELDFPLGEYLQLDHGPADAILSRQRITGYLFVATIPGTSIRYCQFHLTKAFEAWGDFCDKAFRFLGGIFPKCTVDNDSVLKIPSTKKLTQFAEDFQITYETKFVFCNLESGHEKGAVEGSVGFCRRNFMAGLPEYETLDELNNKLIFECKKHLKEGVYYVGQQPLSEIYQDVKIRLFPLKNVQTWTRSEDLVVDKFQCIHYGGYKYSTPEKYIEAKVKVLISVSNINIYDSGNLIASHERLFWGKLDSLYLEHFLPQLERKPKAIDFAKVVKQCPVTKNLLEVRKRLSERLEENEAKIEFLKVLVLQRKYSLSKLESSLEIALSYGGINASAIESIIVMLDDSKPFSNENIRKENLSHECQLTIDNHFDLSKYDMLSTIQGEYCD